VSEIRADVTAIVTCFNYGRFLPEAVESLRAQAGGRPKILVIDDGSTDPATHATLDALPGDVCVVRQANAGVSVARNEGIRRADTPYVLLLDADDRLAADALSTMYSALDARPDLGFVYGHQRFIGDWDATMRLPQYDPYRLLYRHLIGPTALTRMEVMRATGGYDASFNHFEDWELWLNALAHGWRGMRVDVVTHEYRRHRGSKLSGDRQRYRASRRQMKQKHAHLFERRRALAGDSSLSVVGRAIYRTYWGPRPVPARLEAVAYQAMFRHRGRAG
jgi:glycosyltransferase involved in cell wall biosynthesis